MELAHLKTVVKRSISQSIWGQGQKAEFGKIHHMAGTLSSKLVQQMQVIQQNRDRL